MGHNKSDNKPIIENNQIANVSVIDSNRGGQSALLSDVPSRMVDISNMVL